MVTRRSRSSSSSLLPWAARTWKVSAVASYSMIEPPSVPVRRTALATMRCRTSSRSRLELTASPTSDERLELVELGGELATRGRRGRG